jgi:hypothetical protein
MRQRRGGGFPRVGVGRRPDHLAALVLARAADGPPSERPPARRPTYLHSRSQSTPALFAPPAILASLSRRPSVLVLASHHRSLSTMSASSTVASLRRPLARTPSTPPLTDQRKAKLAPKVAEATQAIQQALDQYGCVLLACTRALEAPVRRLTGEAATRFGNRPPPSIAGSTSSRSASMAARTVSRQSLQAVFTAAPC